jgi:hypothetical protein
MIKNIAAILGGVGAAALLTYLVRRKGAQRSQFQTLDLNQCSQAELLALGVEREQVDRIIENRPYRNRLELVSRMVVPAEVFAEIKHRIDVPEDAAAQPVQVA